MNALALLCNLHADGPLTMKRLRRAGCESLPELFELDRGVLAAALDQDPDSTERLLREARQLVARLDGTADADELEAESQPPAPVEPAAPGALPRAVDEAFEVDEAADELPRPHHLARPPAPSPSATPVPADAPAAPEASEAPGTAARPGEAGIAPVLAAWRALDRTSPPTDPEVRALPALEPDGADAPLVDGALEGLDTALLLRLADAGVESLRELAEAPTLDLGRAVGIPFTRLNRFQFLARRALAERELLAAETPVATAPAEPDAADSDADPDWVETAGPFA